MSNLDDPLRQTAPALHRFYVKLADQPTWYAVMRETRRLYGANWRTQPKIRRKLIIRTLAPVTPVVWAWFDVPDPVWISWIATKFAVEVRDTPPRPGK